MLFNVKFCNTIIPFYDFAITFLVLEADNGVLAFFVGSPFLAPTEGMMVGSTSDLTFFIVIQAG